MRVLHVTCGLEPDMGGPPVSVSTFCIAGLRAGIETSLAFSFDRGSIKATRGARQHLRAAGVALLPFKRIVKTGRRSKTWGVSASLVGSVFRLVKNYDIVVVHGPWPVSSLAAVVAAKCRGVKCILVPHESLTSIDMNKPGWLGRITLKRMLRSFYFAVCDAIIVASPLEYEDSRDREGRVNIVVIPHAVYDDQGATLPSPRASVKDPPVIGYIGRLHYKKNIDVLLRALALLPAEYRLRCAGVGAPGITTELRELANALGLAARVDWMGLVSAAEKPPFFASIDLLVMPSLYESFGLVAAEAIMNGVPVVVSPATGVAQLVESHDCGKVVPPTPEKLAQVITQMLGDENHYRTLSSNAIDAARAEVGYSAFAKRIQAIYFSTVGEHPDNALDRGVPFANG